MSKVDQFIDSGILELYVLGQTNPDEAREVEEMASMYSQVGEEINSISLALESYARVHAVEPDPTILPFAMATIDYMERLKKGEAPAFPPAIHEGSKVSDYSEWLNRKDLQLNEPLIDFHARIIGYTPEVTTAIVWLKDGAPPETHDRELEKFLIVEGTCDINVGGDIKHMKAGDVLIIPLHITHDVRVTSDYPCKIVLQRAAA